MDDSVGQKYCAEIALLSVSHAFETLLSGREDELNEFLLNLEAHTKRVRALLEVDRG